MGDLEKWGDRVVFCFAWPFAKFTSIRPKPMESKPNCVFMRMLDGRIHVETIVKKESVWTFHDIAPGAQVHVLAIPTAPIRSVHSLRNSEEHLKLLKDMKEAGIESLRKEGAPGEEDSWVFGFHVPPFNSVDHLHMHCLAGKYTTSGKLKFAKNRHFLLLDKLIDELETKGNL